MASVGDVIRVVSCGNLLGEDFCNVFYYLVKIWTGNVTVEDVKGRFIADVIDVMLPVQVDNLMMTNCNVDNLNDPNEYWEATFARPGTAVGNPMPAFVAVGVQLLRTTKATRHGSKRIAGVYEAMFTEGEFTPTQPFIDALELACQADLIEDDMGGNEFELSPCIVGTDPITGLPDPARTNLVKGALVRRATTQNSRKGYTVIPI